MKENIRIQVTLEQNAFSIFDKVKKELEKATMIKLTDSIPINKIILEWDEFKKNQQKKIA